MGDNLDRRKNLALVAHYCYYEAYSSFLCVLPGWIG